MENFLDIIIIGGFAVFLVFKLINTLGRGEGHQRKPQDSDIHRLHQQYRDRSKNKTQAKKPEARDQQDGPIVEAEVREAKQTMSSFKTSVGIKAKETIAHIQSVDPDFTAEDFLRGAGSAFSLIYDRFSQGNIESVRDLMKSNVYTTFYKQVQRKTDAKERWDFEVIRIKSARLIEGEIDGQVARLSVKFSSERVEAIYNQNGQLIHDTSSEPFLATDQWDFARDLNSENPAWILTRTKGL